MKRREFIAGLGGAAAWPLAARAQKTAVPIIGFLGAGSLPEWSGVVTVFRQGLKDAGFVEGQNLEVDYRWAENRYDRLPSLAVELVRRQVAVIYTPCNTPAALAAKAATTTIPVVFATGGDPVKSGLVASLNRPGTNATGVGFLTSELVPKQFEVILEFVPNAPVIGGLFNSDAVFVAEPDRRDFQQTARVTNRKAVIVTARNDREVDAAFETLAEQRAAALVVHGDAFFSSRREKIVGLAARYKLPAIYALRSFVEVGGLVNYGASFDAANYIGCEYISRILKGERPADLPVQLSTRIEMVLNLKTARALALTIPPNLLALADEVIE
jgi:putative tryptophan/tyrosine transport system substrate-binding protein